MDADSSAAGPAENRPSGAVDHEAVHDRLDAGQLSGDPLPQRRIIPQLLRLHAADHPLGLGDERIEVGIGADVELPEPFEEPGQVFDGRVAEHLRLPVVAPREPFGEMLDEPSEFFEKRRLGQPHRLIEPGLHPLALLPVQIRRELPQVVGWLDAGKVPRHVEQPDQRLRIVCDAVEPAQPLASGGLEGVESLIEGSDRLDQLGLESVHLAADRFEVILADEADAWLRERQALRLEEGHRAMSDGRDSPEGGVAGVEQLLAGGEKVPFRSEGIGPRGPAALPTVPCGHRTR